jgi:hypothetical protein
MSVTLPLKGTRYACPRTPISRPSCDAWITAATSETGVQSRSAGVFWISVIATRIMRSGVMCFGRAIWICALHFSRRLRTLFTFWAAGTSWVTVDCLSGGYLEPLGFR